MPVSINHKCLYSGLLGGWNDERQMHSVLPTWQSDSSSRQQGPSGRQLSSIDYVALVIICLWRSIFNNSYMTSQSWFIEVIWLTKWISGLLSHLKTIKKKHRPLTLWKALTSQWTLSTSVSMCYKYIYLPFLWQVNIEFRLKKNQGHL